MPHQLQHPRRLYDAMAARVERGEFPGLVTLVARDDAVTVDVVGVTERAKGQLRIQDALQLAEKVGFPSWVSVDPKK